MRNFSNSGTSLSKNDADKDLLRNLRQSKSSTPQQNCRAKAGEQSQKEERSSDIDDPDLIDAMGEDDVSVSDSNLSRRKEKKQKKQGEFFRNSWQAKFLWAQKSAAGNYTTSFVKITVLYKYKK